MLWLCSAPVTPPISPVKSLIWNSLTPELYKRLICLPHICGYSLKFQLRERERASWPVPSVPLKENLLQLDHLDVVFLISTFRCNSFSHSSLPVILWAVLPSCSSLEPSPDPVSLEAPGAINHGLFQLAFQATQCQQLMSSQTSAR